MYHEILAIENYCRQIGVKTQSIECMDGYVLRFNNGSDVAQHRGTYGSKAGYVEFGYTGYKNYDFQGIDIYKALTFIKRHKDELNKEAQDEQRNTF